MQMAAVVSHAYLPGVGAESVRVAIAKGPSRFSVSQAVSPGAFQPRRACMRDIP